MVFQLNSTPLVVSQFFGHPAILACYYGLARPEDLAGCLAGWPRLMIGQCNLLYHLFLSYYCCWCGCDCINYLLSLAMDGRTGRRTDRRLDAFCCSTISICMFIWLFRLFLARTRTGFDKSSLARLEQLFRNTVGNEREIRREEFKKIVISKNVSQLSSSLIPTPQS